jgi:small-conductance mechanosensitive channel
MTPNPIDFPAAIPSGILLIAALVLTLLPLRSPLWLRVAIRAGAFAVCTLLVARVLGPPLHPQFVAASAGALLRQQMLETLWWVIGARFVVTVVQLIVVLENRPRETRIMSDLVAGAVYIGTGLAIINFAFAIPIRGLLATSGVIAIVLGLALQSTLADVFSGISVGVEKPYRPGDLIWVEGDIEGRVTQITWRSTHIATAQDNIAIIPNSVIAKARLINLSAPTLMRGDTIEVRLDPAIWPERCIDVLMAAALACRIPCRVPAPSVACTGLHGDGSIYQIGYQVTTSGDLTAARTELFTQLHRHLLYAGIGLAVPGVMAAPSAAEPSAAQVLADSDLLGVLDQTERDELAAHFRPVWLSTNDTLFRQGETVEALFLIVSGVAEVAVSGRRGPHVVGRISPGESLGAIGLVTGAPSRATVTALTPLKVYRLDKASLTTAIAVIPNLAPCLEALAKRGQATLWSHAGANENPEVARPDIFFSKLREFLHRLNE